MKRSDIFFTTILLPFDFAMLLAAGLAAYFLRTSSYIIQRWPVYFHLNLPFNSYLALITGVSLFLIIIFALVGLYKIKAKRTLLEDAPKIVIGVSAGMIILVFYTFFRREWFDSRFLLLAGCSFAIAFVAFGRFAVNLWQKHLMRKYHYGLQKILLIGRDDISRKIADDIKLQPELGYLIVRHLKELDMEKVREAAKESIVEGILLADLDWPRKSILSLMNFCEKTHLTFRFIPNLFQTLTTNSQIGTLGIVPLIEIRRAALDGWWRVVKRVFDIIFSLFFIIFFSPVYFIVALLIKLESPGPIVYKDVRYGHKKKGFVFYKFRSMRADLCDGVFGTREGNRTLEKLEKSSKYNLRKNSALRKMSLSDPRMTMVGKFIRKYSIDEFPQFFNVLRGDMSVVGYRPHLLKEVKKYTEEQEKMFCARPGITGLAQISGRSNLDFDEEARLDLFYIENWSFLLDLIIVLKTPFNLLFKPFKK